jgi:GGDEF domain-containing protein
LATATHNILWFYETIVSEIHERDTAISVVERADAALYLAKDSGRNNVKSEKDLKSAKA